jgi:2-iminoacetate synthase
MNFSQYIEERGYDFETIARRIAGVAADGAGPYIARALERAQAGAELDLDEMLVLLSEAADPYLEEMARVAQHITRKRFGRVVQIYAPMYLSNYCHSTCTYCGFSFGNDIKRLTLSPARAAREAELLYREGIRHILLLTGEDYKETPVEYLIQVCRALHGEGAGALAGVVFPSISVEVYPLSEDDYRLLRTAGVDGLAVYQETYDPRRYREVHLGGMKKRMRYRLDCPDRGGRAGLRRIAIGALLGLSDPAADACFAALHARYLLKQYWQTQISLSLPRLRPAAGLAEVPHVSDRAYVRYLLAMRLFLPDAGLNLSTRESAGLRDSLTPLCITHMSAGSRTEPGGYSGEDSTEQFETEDRRSVAEVRDMLIASELEPVFVDWSPVLK